jgi:hypothetical protein
LGFIRGGGGGWASERRCTSAKNVNMQKRDEGEETVSEKVKGEGKEPKGEDEGREIPGRILISPGNWPFSAPLANLARWRNVEKKTAV